MVCIHCLELAVSDLVNSRPLSDFTQITKAIWLSRVSKSFPLWCCYVSLEGVSQVLLSHFNPQVVTAVFLNAKNSSVLCQSS